MSMWGADPGELDRLGTAMSSTADRLDGISHGMTIQLQSTTWQGTDAEQFTGDWHGVHLPTVGAVSGRLREAAATLHHEAEQQRVASTVGGSGGGGGGGGGFGGVSIGSDVALGALGLGGFLVGDVSKIGGLPSKAKALFSDWKLPGLAPSWLKDGNAVLEDSPIGQFVRSDGFGRVAGVAGDVGKVFGWAGVGIGVVQTGMLIEQHAGADKVTESAVGTAGSALMMIPTPWTVGIGMAIVGANWIATSLDPDWPSDVGHLAGAVGTAVGQAARDVVADNLREISGAEHAVSGFVHHPFGL